MSIEASNLMCKVMVKRDHSVSFVQIHVLESNVYSSEENSAWTSLEWYSMSSIC